MVLFRRFLLRHFLLLLRPPPGPCHERSYPPSSSHPFLLCVPLVFGPNDRFGPGQLVLQEEDVCEDEEEPWLQRRRRRRRSPSGHSPPPSFPLSATIDPFSLPLLSCLLELRKGPPHAAAFPLPPTIPRLSSFPFPPPSPPDIHWSCNRKAAGGGDRPR